MSSTSTMMMLGRSSADTNATMKMENNITTKKDAVVKKILVNLNDMVEVNTPLVELEEEEAE